MTTTGRIDRALSAVLDARVGPVTPSQSWGVFDGGTLVRFHAAGDAAAISERAAFRIASCTKSFTAASALLLEADGLLDLDEPLSEALDVPLRILGPDGPAPTVRDALAMRAGFPTDDPWADRQESLGDDTFGRMLSTGIRTVWPAGDRFEYSNLGYAIVGRIIGLRAGMSFRRVVESRLLGPLGLVGTGFEASVGNAITGYRPSPEGWEPLPFSSPGAFSPIGGLFSTPPDLARWCGVLSGAIEAGPTLPGELVERLRHPVTPIAGDPSGGGAWQAYGLGLTVRSDGAEHLFVGHSGGYPGFTTRMEWEQGTRIGAVVFENAGYTSLTPAVLAAFDGAFRVTDAAPAAAAPPAFEPWSETVAAAEALRASLAAGTLGDPALFDACLDLDAPLPRREAALGALLERIGVVDTVGPLEHATPARASWTLCGPRGALRCGILLTPLAEPRIQKLEVELAS